LKLRLYTYSVRPEVGGLPHTAALGGCLPP
jgi:hypothetical protein